jgi:hypothetical protein
MATYKSAPTGALFDPSKGVGSTFGGDAGLPRSIASDGRRWILFTHVSVHILALVANIVSALPRDAARRLATPRIAHNAAPFSLLVCRSVRSTSLLIFRKHRSLSLARMPRVHHRVSTRHAF